MPDVILEFVILYTFISEFFVGKIIAVVFIIKQGFWNRIQASIKEVFDENLDIPTVKFVHSRHDFQRQVHVAGLGANIVKEHHLVFDTEHFFIDLFEVIH